MTLRKTGYLANLTNLPPLIFRFQFNPEILSEKKTYKYQSAPSFGQWGFDQRAAGAAGGGVSGFFGGVAGAWKDFKEIGSRLVATKPLEPVEGEPRVFELEFQLRADSPGPMDGDNHYQGSILPDLAVLRSFMNPSWDMTDLPALMFKGRVPCLNRPPEATLNYGGLSVTCVMTDLTIKMVAFKDNGDPLRAEVTTTLKEQTLSVTPILEFFDRNLLVARSYVREGIGTDFLLNSPLAMTVDNPIISSFK